MANNKDFTKAVSDLDLQGQVNAIKTFQDAAVRIPAYKHFLKHNGVNPRVIKKFEDFLQLPLVTKDNYLRQYPIRELMWDGDEFNGDIISVSSGSSGEPFFWLRDEAQQLEAADYFYDIYKNSFGSDKIPTLLVVCFSMGIWIAGSYTTLGGIEAKRLGLKMNIINPALDIPDALAVIKRLKDDYDQIILAGYPPFLKDLIDKGPSEGVDWLKLNVGYTPAGEVITEELRNYFIKKGTRYNDPTKVIGLYGTVDAGIVGYETPLSIILRRNIYKNKLQKKLFGRQVLPTLAQYDPTKRYIESINGNIVFTSSTGIPLIRYNIQDVGGTITNLDDLGADELSVEELINKQSIDIKKWARPFVYVHGRSDFTASLYAVLIYPENIKKALLQEEVNHQVSGRFVMSVKYKKNLDQYLEIIVELKENLKPSKEILQHVHHTISVTLSSDNFEYRKLKNSIGKKALPVVILREHKDPQHFSRTTNKQRWTTEALKARG